jgi:hypothetical protein
MSEKRAIKELEGVNDDEAEEILEEVKKEKKDKAADFTSFIDKKGGDNPQGDNSDNSDTGNDNNPDGGKPDKKPPKSKVWQAINLFLANK